ncbi:MULTISPECIES: hypothetical protein [unclassified Bacillus (in: firmicutes)]|uniref:hypothetical protein n=1 Tax=unclassified Bacillus (in: firmicutes) TaxID=185979 RepID=UPI000BF12875|nr:MULTISPECIES: hypothetical protein [unclassified Bacillus (in: firmicutes)]PEJ48529.1 hypothetical protein CN692_24055 [Bacillus sp. AFS002410]PEK99898.1 hypothetical protein CN601_22850 [Bacillus sp. AFS017336]
MWGFCGCNRREEREEVSPVRDMREFVEVRRPCCECKEDDRVMEVRMEEMKEVEPAMNERKGCGCRKNRRRSNNNSMVSPAESSFCQRQLDAARNGCVVNPLTNFSRCR